MPRDFSTAPGPTEFWDWWYTHPDQSDESLSEATRAIDPEEGICPRTVRRVRYGERSDSKGIYLLMLVTGLPFEAFLPREWRERCSR